MAREAGTVRDGHQGHLASPARESQEGRGRSLRMLEVLVGSTQDEDVGALVGAH